MKHLLIIILLLISITIYSAEPPAKISITCSQSNDCKIKFDIQPAWKIYMHDENNSESLNFAVNHKMSENVESIQVDWDSQKGYSEELMNMKIDYYESGSDINFQLYTKDNNYKLVLDVNYAACNETCTVFKDQVIYNRQNNGIIYMLMLAILGGLILNFMPCVLPIVWLKVMYISKKCQRNIRKTKIEIFFIVLGIITSFAFLAIMTIIMRDLGGLVGWGMHFQEPAFVGFIAMVTAIGALNMLGLFEIKTPQFLQKVLDSADGKIGDFLHGVFIVLLATPCTAPFLGTAVAFCLTQPSKIIFLFYIAIGIGLSIPYLILITSRNAIKILPKPGRWMEKLKLATAIPFAGTSIWMFYVLYKQSPYAALLLIVVVIIFIAIYNIRFGVISLIALGMVYFGSSMIAREIKSKEFEVKKISDEVKLGRTVLVNITSDWCITCKINEQMVFNDEAMLDELKKNGTIIIIGDYTSNSKSITDYIKLHKRSGIPLSVVYGPAAPDGIVLPVIFTKNDLIMAIDKARKM
jgi:suppressor for copper-sensitivity B